MSKPLNILVIGAGGREHALVRKLLTSPTCGALVCAPGSDAIALETPCVDIFAPSDIVHYCTSNGIDLVVVGPEGPLVMGLADLLREAGIAVFGPGEAGAQLEASKDFTKRLCDAYHIPTAKYATFADRDKAIAYIRHQGAPIVVKADGLAAGKGVTVAATVGEAVKAVEDCFDGAFGEAGARVVIEECMVGEEASFFALCDGQTATAFASAQDHKRAYDNDQGPNTGGMGTFSPTPNLTEALEATVMRDIIVPTINGLREEGIHYIGVLFAGLMLTKDGPKLIEYNCRFGDPETQSMLARYEGDLAALLYSCAKGAIAKEQIKFSKEAAVCVVMAATGYPGEYVRNSAIDNLDKAAEVYGVSIFHAGTKRMADDWVSWGGRVLNVIGVGPSLRQARYRAYEAIDLIEWKDGFCRRDIAASALQK